MAMLDDPGRVGEIGLPVQDGGSMVALSNVPLAVKLTIKGMVSGSRARITRDDTNELLLNAAESGGVAQLSTKHKGALTIEVRKADASPYYKSWFGAATLVDADQTMTAIQILEE